MTEFTRGAVRLHIRDELAAQRRALAELAREVLATETAEVDVRRDGVR